jgi:hypothetical protein
MACLEMLQIMFSHTQFCPLPRLLVSDHNENGRNLSVGPNLPAFPIPYNATVGRILSYTELLSYVN